MSTFRVEANLEVCQGHSECVVEAPEYFEFDKPNGVVHILRLTVDEADLDDVRAAVTYCPNQALALIEETS